ncbi:uncharacterized protein LOC110697745 [Chenopodium quinoa]|uniref:H15 domain-containing protein n=1 Tax=Chenopodium quinoa TaxID=63459 RepID=A0A803N9Q1_CHEQI|nr:uncharacterized protein LOC110697745 [Chenopodium quinoa]
MADPRPALRSSKHARIMENFKNSVFNVANSYSIKPFSPSQIAFIEQQLLLAFPAFQTPTHPTYTAMIETAVKELDEEYGSNEESISKYIKENYDGLPWARSVYLSHHLSRMCENGEIVCTSDNRYTTPALIEECNWRGEPLKQRLGRRIIECAVEEGNLGGQKVAEASGDVIGFKEEDIMVLRRSRVKRRRRSCVVEEDDESEGGGIVGEEHNISSCSRNMVVDKCNEVGVLEDEDDIAWRSRSRRRSSLVVEEDDEVWGAAVVDGGQEIISSSNNLVVRRRNEMVLKDVIDLTGEARETSEEWGGIETVGEDHDLVNVPVEQLVVGGLKSELLPTECQFEVKCQALLLDDDECERKSETKLLVPSSVGVLQAKHESEVITETMSMDEDKSAAELVLEPVECVEKSSVKDLVLKESELLIRIDVDEVAVKKSALKESELMIVPFEGNTPLAAVSAGTNPTSLRIDPVIVCGLPVEQEQPQRKRSVYHTKKRLKACQKKMKVYSKSVPSLPALTVDRNLLDHSQLQELSSQRGFETKPCSTLLESPNFKGLPAGQSQQACSSSLIDGFKDQLDRQKSPDPWYHHSSWEELISVDDEENLPLQQVLEKCGKRRRHVAQMLTQNKPLMTEASSISNSNSHVNLPKRKEKQLQKKLKPQDQNCSNFEADTVAATESMTPPSPHMVEWRNRQSCVDHVPQIGVMDPVEEISDMLPHHQHLGQGKDQGSSLQFKLAAETFPSNDGHIWKDNQQTGGDHTLLCEPENSAKVNTVELPLTQHLNGQKDELYIGEMVTTAVIEDKVSTLDQNYQQLIDQQEPTEETTTSFFLQRQCLWEQEVPSKPAFNLVVEETLSKLCQINKISNRELATDQQNVCPEVEPSEFIATEHVVSDILQCEQEKEKHQKQVEPSLQNPKHQIEHQEVKSQIDVRLQPLEATMCTLEEENVPTRPQKQVEESKEDAVPSLDEQLQLQKGLLKPATHWNQKQQNKQKTGRGRPRKEESATKVKADSLTLQLQVKKRGRPRKQKEETEGSAIVIMNVHLQQEGLSELEIDQNPQLQTMQSNNDGPERPLKQVEASKEDDLGSSNLHFQQQDESSEFAFSSNTLHKVILLETDGQKQPWIETNGVKEDAVVSSNLHLHLQEGSCEPSTGHYSHQHTKDMKEENLERPWKQLEAATEDAVASLNLHAHRQEGSSEPESGQNSQQQFKQPEKDCLGRSPKQIEAAKEDTAASSILHLQKLAGFSDPATLSISQQHISEKLQSKVHRTSETGQTTPPSDDETCQQLKKHKLHIGGQRPKTRAMTASSDNQPDQQQKELLCHEQEGSQGEFEGGQRPKTRAMTTSSNNQPDQQQIVQRRHEHERTCGKFEGVQGPKTRAVTTSDNQSDQHQNEWHCHKHEVNLGKLEVQRPKTRAMTTSSDNQPDQQLNESNCQKAAKISVVPLASIDQLRSRIKRQSLDST